MSVKKLLLAVGVVLLGVALFFAGTAFAQMDEGSFDRGWAEMMHGDEWEHGPMHHAWEDHSEHGADCPYDDDDADHMDAESWDSWEEHHDAMHGAHGYGHMMGDWVQPEGDPGAPAEDFAE